MVEEERLAASPILEVNLGAVFYFDRIHVLSPCVLVAAVFLWANKNRVKTATADEQSRDSGLQEVMADNNFCPLCVEHIPKEHLVYLERRHKIAPWR
jgi:hypothetical protein